MLYTTGCKHKSSSTDDGRNYRLKHVELIEIFITKLLLMHLVVCLYYCIRDAKSHKHQNKKEVIVVKHEILHKQFLAENKDNHRRSDP
jgi:hypothetical protein